ncbi:MAG: hypothetical protein NT001_06255 [Candidatus Woesearchaeota archaeon]|nr:hypothetical protein [Candidatus Woesearchaeota archaeon]
MPKKQDIKKRSITELVKSPGRQLETRDETLRISRPFSSVKKVRYVFEAVPGQYSFYLHDGRTLKNLNDLIKSLDTMPDDIYNFHANSSKNDFSNWVRDIIGEPELSLGLLSKDRAHAKAEIINFLRKRGSFKG